MAIIKQIQLHNFRLFNEQKILFGEQLNLLCGINTSGKTSVLESIWLLSSGSSFRTKNMEELTQFSNSKANSTADFHIKSVIGNKKNSEHNTLEFIRYQQKNSYFLDKIKQKNIQPFAKLCPILLIIPENLTLINGLPQLRRQRLNWGCFYHFPLFSNIYARFKRALKQRNSALNQQKSDSEIHQWDIVLAKETQFISACHKHYLEELKPTFEKIVAQLIDSRTLSKITLQYDNQFKNDNELSEQFWLQQYQRTLNRDRREKTTSLGPHRCDIRFIIEDGQLNIKQLSRGQHKIIACAFLLAQAHLVQQKLSINPILLIDDFSSELDENHRYRLIKYITNELQSQAIISAVSKDLVPKDFQQQSTIIELAKGL